MFKDGSKWMFEPFDSGVVVRGGLPFFLTQSFGAVALGLLGYVAGLGLIAVGMVRAARTAPPRSSGACPGRATTLVKASWAAVPGLLSALIVSVALVISKSAPVKLIV